MAKQRGGGRGSAHYQGQGGNKRTATTPVGGAYKDSRRGIDGDEDYDDEEEWTQVIRNKQKSPVAQSGSGSGPDVPNQPDTTGGSNSGTNQEAVSGPRPSFASVVGQGNTMQSRRDSTVSAGYTREKKTLQRIFRTPDPDGPMRDDIVIEIRTVNDMPFKGSLTFTEAKDGVYGQCLGLDIKILHGIRFAFSTYPVVKFKLKEQIDVDRILHHTEYFDFERRYTVKGVEKSDILGCKIKGLRTGNVDGRDFNEEADPDPNIRWVKIEWADYGLEESQILDWLNFYGEQAGQLTEDIHPNSDSDADPLGNGTFSIKMRLKKDIPQLLPMWGKRIRIYHRGVQKLCSNCFGTHPRKNCRSEKVPWTRYVLNFMERNPDIPSELYGRWWKVINDEFGEIITGDDQITQGAENTNPRPVSAMESEPAETQINQQQTTTHRNTTRTDQHRKNPRLTREEEENLADYLNLGMSINEAKEAFRVELEAAELRLKVRENKRARQAGSIQLANRTRMGPSASGRGGLTFN